ncbi:hypothetical protein FB107DRAFT_280601 [Schizophyllum commune]
MALLLLPPNLLLSSVQLFFAKPELILLSLHSLAHSLLRLCSDLLTQVLLHSRKVSLKALACAVFYTSRNLLGFLPSATGLFLLLALTLRLRLLSALFSQTFSLCFSGESLVLLTLEPFLFLALESLLLALRRFCFEPCLLLGIPRHFLLLLLLLLLALSFLLCETSLTLSSFLREAGLAL